MVASVTQEGLIRLSRSTLSSELQGSPPKGSSQAAAASLVLKSIKRSVINIQRSMLDVRRSRESQAHCAQS